MIKQADLSEDKLYRYHLCRIWEPSLTDIAWLMLNPSTADAEKDDATIRRCINFSREWGYGGIRVYNLFALRATNPHVLMSAVDPVGPLNDEWLKTIPAHLTIVAAWGAQANFFPDRVLQVMKIINGRLVSVLGWTAENQPKHPLRLSKEIKLRGWGEPH